MSDNSSDPSQIEHDLDQTRSRLGGHLSELQSRLSPGQVLDDLVRYFRGNEGADFGRSLVSSVRANPLPVALTGIGLTWLMATNAGRGMTGARADKSNVRVYRGAPALEQEQDTFETRMRAAEKSVVRPEWETDHAYAGRVESARGQTVGITRQAKETTESFSQRVADALAGAKQAVVGSAQDLRDQVSDKASVLGSTAQGTAASVSSAAQGAAQRAGDVLTQSGQAVGRVSSSLMGAIIENPVLLSALGLAAGALLGGLLPQSDQEEAALGGVAGQARDTARGLAQEAVDRGSHVAQAVAEAGHNSAQAHSLAGGQSVGNLVDAALTGELAGNLKQVATDVLHTGDEAIRKEVPGQSVGNA